MVWLRSLAFALMLAGLVHAAAVKRQDITALSSSKIASYAPFTYFASTAYCKPSTTIDWSCGANCQGNADFQPVASGGDGDAIQFWYVGFSPSQNTVIVAHQGTGGEDIIAYLTDVDLFLKPLSSSLFPGVPASVQVHSGFSSEQALTASSILSAVQKTLSAHGSALPVTVVGHSLGAALALLDGLYLSLNLPNAVRVIGYGMPRVGNQAFANWVDAGSRLSSGQVTHINNEKDPVPILPGRLLGYHHASGEVHITGSGTWENCPGQDNPSKLCVVGDVPTILQGKPSDHLGPYDGILMGCK